MPGLMVTDGGPHPADKWAVMTGEHIFPIDPKADSERLIDARKVQMKIIEALLPHHHANMEAERGNLKTKGDAHLTAPYAPEDAAKAALAEIVSILKGTPWEAKTIDPDWLRIVEGELATHFATAQNIERQWHCHRSKTPAAKQWLAVHHPEPEVGE